MMDDRGVSMPLQYVLLVAIIGLLAGGLFVTTGGFVGDQREDAVDHGLEVVGARLATDIVAADRLAGDLDASDAMTLRVETPESIAGSTYVVSVEPTGTPGQSVLTLESGSVDTLVEVEVSTDHELAAASVAGGVIEIHYDPATDRLEVRNG